MKEMIPGYQYKAEDFAELVPVLLELEDATGHYLRSIKCFPPVNCMPHVYMDDTPEFRAWIRRYSPRIVQMDDPKGYVKLLTPVERAVVYTLIPEADAEEWRT